MRGKVLKKNGHEREIRITPAYAGKSATGKWIGVRNQDHPRLCGEKHRKNCKPLNTSGSPPPMRGKAGSVLPIS